MSTSIPFTEWLAEVERLAKLHGNEEFKTVSELSDSTRCNSRLVQKYLQLAKKEGRLECRHVPREAIDGKLRYIPAYKIAKKGKK